MELVFLFGVVMKWLVPPRIKVFEALGCIADGRISVEDDFKLKNSSLTTLGLNVAKVFSSSKGKFYTVTWSQENNAIMSNLANCKFARHRETLFHNAIICLIGKMN